MGKQAKAKKMRGAARTDPMSASGKAGGDGGAMEAETEEVTGQIVSELEDMSAERRAKAAHAVAGVAATGMVGLKALMRMGVVGKLTRLLCDQSVDVRAAAAAALRNTGIRGGDAGYTAIVDADVMTPLLASLQQSGVELSAGGERMEKAVELACILLDLLWELCESSIAAVNRFNAGGAVYLTSLVHLICPPLSTAAPGVAASAAQCLHVLSEDNPHVESFFKAQPGALVALHSVIASPESPALVAALAAGTAINLSPECRPPDLPASLTRIFSSAMKQDHMSSLPQALSHVQAAATGNLQPRDAVVAASAGVEGEGAGREEGVAGAKKACLKAITQKNFQEEFLHTEVEAAEEVRREMDEWSKKVTLSQISLQILANMLLSAAEELADEEGSEGWESAGEDDIEGMHEESDGGLGGSEGDGDVAEWAIQSGLLEAACALCQYPPKEVLEAVVAVGEPALPALETLCGMQVNALDCVANWVSCAPESSGAELAAVCNNVMGTLCTAAPLIVAQMPPPCASLLQGVEESLSGLASAYVRRWALSAGPATMTGAVHECLGRWVQNGASRSTRSNAVCCLGAMGKAQREPAANGAIGTLLLGVVQNSGDVVAASEALGAIYDCYAEDDVNQSVLAPMGMMPILAAVQASFLAASKQWLQEVKGQAKADPEVRRDAAMVKEARANLPRFIAYKKEMGLTC